MLNAANISEEIDLTIAVQHHIWHEITPNFEDYVEKICHTILLHQYEKLKQRCPNASNQPVQIALVFTDSAEMQKLNKQFRGKDYPTNVLSFAADSDGLQSDELEIILGDIILAYEVIALEAEEQNKHFIHHLTHLIVHGILHLLGYDHMIDLEADAMENVECEILRLFNISDPYFINDQKYDINLLHN
jgi:probable rRNA maturation factor